MDVLIISLSVLLAIAIIGLVIIIIKYKKDQSHWKYIAEENLNVAKEQADRYIRETVESISEDRHRFESMSEKQLMIETLITLSATTRRIDYLNDKMSWLTDCRLYIQNLNMEIQKCSENNNNLQKQLIDSATHLQHMYNSVNQLNQSINQLNSKIGNVETLQNRVATITQNSNEEIQKMTTMQQRLSSVMKDIGLFLSNYGNGPLSKIDSIANNMRDVQEKLEDIYNKICYVQSKISDVEDNMDDVKDNISDVKDNMSDIKDDMNDVKNNLNYGGSIYYQIEEIKDMIMINRT